MNEFTLAHTKGKEQCLGADPGKYSVTVFKHGNMREQMSELIQIATGPGWPDVMQWMCTDQQAAHTYNSKDRMSKSRKRFESGLDGMPITEVLPGMSRNAFL